MNKIIRLNAIVLLVLSLSACGTLGGGSKKAEQAAEINTKLALAYMRNGDLTTAKEKLDRALGFDSGYADAHHAYALFYERVKKPALSEKSFMKAIRYDKKNPEIINNYGGFLCRHGRVVQAEEQFLKAAGNPLYKTPEYAYANAGVCVLKQGDVTKAIAYLEQALTVNPLFPTAVIQLAEIELKQGDAIKASSRLQAFHKSTQGTPDSLYLAVKAAESLGRFEEAQRYGLLLKATYPDSKQARAVNY